MKYILLILLFTACTSVKYPKGSYPYRELRGQRIKYAYWMPGQNWFYLGAKGFIRKNKRAFIIATIPGHVDSIFLVR